MYLALWLESRWRLPTTPCFTLPVAVSLKRFLTPLFVLSLGIFVSCLSTITDGHGSPHWPGSPSDRKRQPIGDASAKRKQPDTFAPQPVGHEMRDSETVIQMPPPGSPRPKRPVLRYLLYAIGGIIAEIVLV